MGSNLETTISPSSNGREENMPKIGQDSTECPELHIFFTLCCDSNAASSLFHEDSPTGKHQMRLDQISEFLWSHHAYFSQAVDNKWWGCYPLVLFCKSQNMSCHNFIWTSQHQHADKSRANRISTFKWGDWSYKIFSGLNRRLRPWTRIKLKVYLISISFHRKGFLNHCPIFYNTVVINSTSFRGNQPTEVSMQPLLLY